MQVSVRFFTTLREITGKREETLKFQGDKTVTVDMILKRLAKHYGKSFVGYVYNVETGEVKSFLQFLVNGRSAPNSDMLHVKLSNGDVLAIIPPVGGG
ncbi:MAG TPA: MoaD family protein [Candidatus Bathyarchaeia archaeon]|nr:MoaD family protein [Candidatus Bathyarchaeia archaeon]